MWHNTKYDRNIWMNFSKVHGKIKKWQLFSTIFINHELCLCSFFMSLNEKWRNSKIISSYSVRTNWRNLKKEGKYDSFLSCGWHGKRKVKIRRKRWASTPKEIIISTTSTSLFLGNAQCTLHYQYVQFKDSSCCLLEVLGSRFWWDYDKELTTLRKSCVACAYSTIPWRRLEQNWSRIRVQETKVLR